MRTAKRIVVVLTFLALTVWLLTADDGCGGHHTTTGRCFEPPKYEQEL